MSGVPSHPPPGMTNGAPGASASSDSLSPSPTLYITGLPDKVKKPDMRLLLYTLFATYGPVLDVVVMRTPKMREQAHVVFKDSVVSTQAMRGLQSFELNGSKLNIKYAKGRSKVFSRLQGDYKPPVKQVESTATELQQSIFKAPGGAETTAPAVNGTAPPPQGTKRPREEDSEEEQPMDEDDDEDVDMEADSDDD